MKVVFLGGGNMANALIGGLLKRGITADNLSVIEVDADSRTRLSASYGVRCHDGTAGFDWAVDVIVLAVKPQQMKAAIAPIIPHLTGQLLVSIAAGLRLDSLSRWLGGYRLLVRCMPNTPALIGAGVTGLYAPPEVSFEQRRAAERILRAAGSTVWIDHEAQMDAVTAISGSGPAYIFLFIEAVQQAAVELGLTPAQARQLSIETMLGAAQLAWQSEEAPAVLRERVTSKGGTTEAALEAMLRCGFKESIVAGIMAANARGVELGKMLGAE